MKDVSSVVQEPFYRKLSNILLAVVILGFLLVLGKEVLSPLMFGLLFAILLLPVSGFFERKMKFSRGASAVTSVIMLLVGIASLLLVLGTEISNLGHDLPELKAQVIVSLHHLQEWISDTFHLNTAKQMDYLKTATSKIKTATPSMIGSTVMSVSSMLLFLIFVILDTFFILFYRRRLLKFLLDVFRPQNAATVLDIAETVQSIIRKYVIGLLLEMATVAAVCCSVFLLLGIRYAILLGLITAIFNIVPYIGIFSALLLSVLITFATTAAATKVLLVIVTVVVMHLVDSNVLLPLIVGSKVRINAFITLLGVVLGEMIWGISGMFLSIPVIAIIKIIFDRVETLKPWGHLLGDEEIEPRYLDFGFKKMRKRIPMSKVD